ncbi:PREDICTED: uncharacterized protein LOC107167117 [Diuraphis noxia]|uniref:uncharacterized protein LOC107167117 n=1 Tax=Diuraphis noxia TaxID=143948 RepID=UPI00076382E8|nr:PREDICTED: uncharacterized protein LOC107167117 [Diuraphis noxia]
MYRLFLALCLCYGLLGYASSEETTTSVYEHCGNLQLQENIQIKLITGTWYVIEILQHKTDDKQFHGEKFEVPTCPSVFLTLAGSDTDLKLYWSEDTGDIEYLFKIKDKSSPGFWLSSGSQNGTLVQVTNYDQFAGMVYVRKAISNHMVLTFCSPNTQLYSVVLSRDKTLDAKELKSIVNHMHLQKLPITQTKRTCRSSASTARATAWMTTAFGLTYLVWYLRVHK